MSLCAFAFFDGRKRTLLAHEAYTYPCIIPVFFPCFFQFPPELLACQPETKEHRNSRYTRNNLYRFRRESDIRTESLEYRIYINIEMLLKSFNTSIFQLFLTIISRNKFFFIRYSSLIIFNLAVSFSFFWNKIIGESESFPLYKHVSVSNQRKSTKVNPLNNKIPINESWNFLD